jgi:hypothetical protein
LQLADLGCRKFAQWGGADQDQSFDAIWLVESKAEGGECTYVDANDCGPCDSEGGKGQIQVRRLSRNTEVGRKWPIRLAVSQHVNRKCSGLPRGQRGPNVSPEE